MAFYLTYDSLTTKLLEYLNREGTNVVSSIPMFIMLGERRVSRDLNILGTLKYISGVFNTGGTPPPPPPDPRLPGILSKPDRWLKTNSFFVGYNELNETGYNTMRPLLNRDNAFCFFAYPNANEKGLPKFYADYEYYQYLVVPTPDQDYTYLISYYQVPELLDDSVSTNFLTDYDPDILIAAAMIEGCLYLKNFQWAQEWEKKYQNALQSMSVLNTRLQSESTLQRGG